MFSLLKRQLFSFVVFFKEVRSETKKVNWLEREEIVRYTGLVFGVSFVVAAYLGALDFIFTWALRTFIL